MGFLKVIVGMGKTAVIKKGTKALLSSGDLTVCSAAIFKIVDNKNRDIAILMSHRGVEPTREFKWELYRQVAPFLEKNCSFVPIAFHTAPDTATSSVNADCGHSYTDDALMQDFAAVTGANIDEMRKSLTPAPKNTVFSTISEVTVDENLKTVVRVPPTYFEAFKKWWGVSA